MNDEMIPIGEPEYRVTLVVSRDMVVVTEDDAPQYYRLSGDGQFVRCSEDEAQSLGVKRLSPGDRLAVRITASFNTTEKPAWWDAAWADAEAQRIGRHDANDR